MQRDFLGRVVVITGAAGARIAALDCNAAGAEALAVELRSLGRQAFGLACAVTDAADCERAMAAAKHALHGFFECLRTQSAALDSLEALLTLRQRSFAIKLFQ